jgi:ubiquitin-protein ligase E3 C
MFNQQKIQILLGGVNAPVDLRCEAEHGLHDDDHPTITVLWRVRLSLHIDMLTTVDPVTFS